MPPDSWPPSMLYRACPRAIAVPERWSRPQAKQKKRSGTVRHLRIVSRPFGLRRQRLCAAAAFASTVSFRSGPSVFKDQGKLSFDYLPDKMVHREQQTQRLFSLLRPIVEAGTSSNAFLYGPVGTGKTHTAKRFCLDFKRHASESDRAVDWDLVNCRQRMGDDAVLLKLIQHFDTHFPERGFSIAEKMETLRRHLEKHKLHFIADLGSEFGDARYAIELLEKAGMLADEERADEIAPEHVRGAKAHVHPTDVQERLGLLDVPKKLVLLAIARKSRKKAYITMGDAEEAYAVVCEEYDEKPRAHTQFWKYVRDLDALGLVDTKLSGEGVVGKTTLISLPEIPAKVLSDNLERSLKRR